MKVKVSEATPKQIDWMVAMCAGVKAMRCGAGKGQYLAYVPKRSAYKVWRPTTNWSQAGPIIEREKITLLALSKDWEAQTTGLPLIAEDGPTPLIAAMRCYCCSKLGDIVDIPEELCQQQNG